MNNNNTDTDWIAIRQKKDELLNQVSDEYKRDCLNKSGIYSISIEGQLVYIGESKSILDRWIAHKINTLYDFNQKDYKEGKYRVLREAYNAGLSIQCNMLEECVDNKDTRLQIEKQWIKKEKPMLNGGKHNEVYKNGHALIEQIIKEREKNVCSKSKNNTDRKNNC